MRTGAIFARGSCRALKWMALVGAVFALGHGEALAQQPQRYTLSAPTVMTEGQSLVPVTVSFTAPAQSGRAQTSVSVVVSVSQPTAGHLTAARLPAIAVLESSQPPVTRAELDGSVGSDGGGVDLTDANADVQWMPSTDSAVTIDNSAGTATMTFTFGEENVNLQHTAFLRTMRDSGDAEEELFRLSVPATVTSSTAPGGNATVLGNAGIVVRIDDVQDQAYVIDFPGNNDMTINEGMPAVLEVRAVPDRTVNMPFRVNLASTNGDTNDYGLDASPASISQDYTLNAGAARPFTVTTVSPDGDRADDTVTITALTTALVGTQNPLVAFELNVIDQHKLPAITITRMTIPNAAGTAQVPVTSIPEGTVGTITLTADRSRGDVPNTEAVTVTLSHLEDDSTAATGDYTLGSRRVVIAGHATNTMMTGTFTVDVDEDEDINLDDPESLVLGADVEGSAVNGPNPSTEDPHVKLAAIPFTDATIAQITARSDADIDADVMEARETGAGTNNRWTPGETMVLGPSHFFVWNTDVSSVSLGGPVSGDRDIATPAINSFGNLEITAVGGGTTEISVTGTARPVASSATSMQTRANEVTVKFYVTVDPPAIVAKGNAQDVADAAVGAAAAKSENGIWEPAPNGAVAMIALSDLFDVPNTITANYLAASDDEGDITAKVVGMNVELTPRSEGMATITVTAVDTAPSGQAVSVDFNVSVMAQAAVRGLSQAAVDAVFEAAGADDLVAQGPSISVDASDLFEMGPNVTPTYPATSSDMEVLGVSTSGTMLMLTPGQGVAGGSATITVTALDSTSGAYDSVEYMAMVDKLPPMLTITSEPMSGSAVEEGSTITVTATLNQEAPHDKSIELQVSGPATGPEAIMLATGAMSASATLTVNDDNAVMAMPDVVVVASHEAIAGGSAVLNFSVTEDDVETTYTLTASAETVEEGGEVTITATASQEVLEDTMIELSQTGGTADDGDYGLDPMSITIMMGETTGTATLTATDDYDVEGNESLTLQGAMGGMIVGSVMITIEDNDVETTYTLTASAETVEEGGEVTITATASQMVRANTEVMVMRDGASSADMDDYSLAPPLITIMEGETEGSLTLTATDDTDVEGNENLTLNGMVGDMAAGSVTLAITDNDMDITYTLSGPEDMNIAEGGSAELTATASSAVHMDTEVMVMRDGSSTASDADFTAESIMIKAGEMTGTTMVMAVEDNEPDSGAGSPEMLTLYGMVDGTKTNSVSFYLWDAAVPALPVIAQLLLAAFLALGGYRRYRRR